jgi:hypothetical protein
MNTTQRRSFRTFLAVLLVLTISVKDGIPRTDAGGGEEKVEKKKNINRSFSVNSSEKLKIDNSFGRVEIKKGGSGEIKVNIDITVKCSDEETAQKTLDAIRVKEERSGGVISFITETGKINHNQGKGEKNHNREFTINYTVYMPAENPLYAENSFGTLQTEDRAGETTLISKFGKLEAGNIARNNNITVEFGKATIGSVNGGKLVFKFSSNIQVSGLSGETKLVSEYSSGAYTLLGELTGLHLITAYSSTRLNLPAALPASITANCSFGSVVNKTAFPLTQVKDEDHRYGLEKNYEGQSGGGQVKIKIQNSFGEVRLMNPGDKDTPKEKDKKKEEGSRI